MCTTLIYLKTFTILPNNIVTSIIKIVTLFSLFSRMHFVKLAGKASAPHFPILFTIISLHRLFLTKPHHKAVAPSSGLLKSFALNSNSYQLMHNPDLQLQHSLIKINALYIMYILLHIEFTHITLL